MGPPIGISEETKKSLAKQSALERAAKRCPILKKANEVLDRGEEMDMEHAIDLIIIEFGSNPIFQPAKAFLKRLKAIEPKNCDQKEVNQ